MKCTHITAYLDGNAINHVICPDSHAESLAKYRRMFPEHKDCILVAKTIEPTEEVLNAYFRSECVI